MNHITLGLQRVIQGRYGGGRWALLSEHKLAFSGKGMLLTLGLLDLQRHARFLGEMLFAQCDLADRRGLRVFDVEDQLARKAPKESMQSIISTM